MGNYFSMLAIRSSGTVTMIHAEIKQMIPMRIQNGNSHSILLFSFVELLLSRGVTRFIDTNVQIKEKKMKNGKKNA